MSSSINTTLRLAPPVDVPPTVNPVPPTVTPVNPTVNPAPPPTLHPPDGTPPPTPPTTTIHPPTTFKPEVQYPSSLPPLTLGGGQGSGPTAGDPKIKDALLNGLDGGQYTNPNDPNVGKTIQDQLTNFKGYTDPNAAASNQLIQQWLANPSAYSSDLFKTSLNQGTANINEQYGLQSKDLNEQMARRGMFNSSLAVGNLGDIGIQKDRALADMTQNLLMDQAHTLSSDRSAALGASNAANAGGINAYNTNESALQGRTQNYLNYNQNNITNSLNAYNTNEQARQARIAQAMGYDQDVWGRSFQQNQANSDNDYRMQQLYAQMMGY